MTALCALCEMAAPDEVDVLCALCRIEVTAASEVVHDPVVIVLSGHLPMCLNDRERLCLCGESFDGPHYHRMHVAERIYEALGLPGPVPNTPASDEIES